MYVSHYSFSLPYPLELGVWNTITVTFVYSPGYVYFMHNGLILSVETVQVRTTNIALTYQMLIENMNDTYIMNVSLLCARMWVVVDCVIL